MKPSTVRITILLHFLTWKAIIDSSVSTVSWSLDKRETMRPSEVERSANIGVALRQKILPSGVVSKKDTGERRTAKNASLNICSPAVKLA